MPNINPRLNEFFLLIPRLYRVDQRSIPSLLVLFEAPKIRTPFAWSTIPWKPRYRSTFITQHPKPCERHGTTRRHPRLWNYGSGSEWPSSFSWSIRRVSTSTRALYEQQAFWTTSKDGQRSTPNIDQWTTSNISRHRFKLRLGLRTSTMPTSASHLSHATWFSSYSIWSRTLTTWRSTIPAFCFDPSTEYRPRDSRTYHTTPEPLKWPFDIVE